MDLGIRNKRALVTGAGRGIGRAIALFLAKEGAKVAVVSRTKKELDTLVKEMGGKNKGHVGLAMDLMPEAAPVKLSGKLRSEFGSPEIIVHNLGGTIQIRDPLCSRDDLRRLWRFNVEIAAELNLLLVPAMKKQGWGRIVHVSSLAGKENTASVGYSTVKAALNAYVKSLGRVLAKDKIIMSAVLPGPVLAKGGHWENVRRKNPGYFRKYILDQMPIGRLAAPEEIAGLVLFLCSKEASFCAGSLMTVDGGQGRAY
jgi:3-oxoacyl-[acyl-carrier protein] reductase